MKSMPQVWTAQQVKKNKSQQHLDKDKVQECLPSTIVARPNLYMFEKRRARQYMHDVGTLYPLPPPESTVVCEGIVCFDG